KLPDSARSFDGEVEGHAQDGHLIEVSIEADRVQAERSYRMSQVELERPLEARALREIERSLHGKLRAYRLPPSFIERCGEDALQKAVVEYLRAVKEGIRVENRDAFIVRTAFCRAIDELRREIRQADAAGVEAFLEAGRFAAPPSEEIAVEHLAAEELR